jgi:hypothetical protein
MRNYIAFHQGKTAHCAGHAAPALTARLRRYLCGRRDGGGLPWKAGALRRAPSRPARRHARATQPQAGAARPSTRRKGCAHGVRVGTGAGALPMHGRGVQLPLPSHGEQHSHSGRAAIASGQPGRAGSAGVSMVRAETHRLVAVRFGVDSRPHAALMWPGRKSCGRRQGGRSLSPKLPAHAR